MKRGWCRLSDLLIARANIIMKRAGIPFAMLLTFWIGDASVVQYASAYASAAMRVNNWELSPNGQTAAISSAIWETQENAWHNQVWVVGLSQRKPETLAIIQNAYAPKYSPSGDILAYVSDVKRVAFPPGESDTRISVFSTAGKASHDLTTGFSDQQPVWSGDGSAIAFARILRDKPGMQGYVTEKMEDGVFGSPNPIGSVQSAVSGLTWRPAHNEVAYVATKLEFESFESGKGRTRSFDIILADTKGKAQTITTSGDVAYKSLSWSPDGRNLAYARETPYLVNKPGGGGMFTKLVAIEPNKKEYHEMITTSQIVDTPVRVRNLRWSSDGKQILFDVLTLDKAAKTDIALVEWPDGKFRWLTRDGKSKLPRWSSDGRTIMYVHADSEIWSVNAEGSRNQKVYDLEY